MATSVYTINKGINKPIEFKGLKAQYIWWLGGGLLALLILFAALYLIGVNPFVCVGLILLLGAGFILRIYKLSRTYGEHGMMKTLAKRSIPKVIRSYSRKPFLSLCKKN